MEKENYKSAYVYMEEDYYNQPKELFKYVYGLMKGEIVEGKEYSVLDIGCAKGELLYYLKMQHDFKRKVGVDFSHMLIAEGKKYEGLNDVEFICDRAESFDFNEKFDFVIMMGVLSFFDEIAPPLDNIKKHLKDSGQCLITGIFNENDIDVRVRHRNNVRSENFENGWNIHSVDSIRKYLNNIGMDIVNVDKFYMPFEIERKPDAARSWTIVVEGEQKFMNGLNIIYNMITLDVRMK